jgi:uncharacterized damage-inducible protein DinB
VYGRYYANNRHKFRLVRCRQSGSDKLAVDKVHDARVDRDPVTQAYNPLRWDKKMKIPVKLIVEALCLIAITGPATHLTAQVNPYKDGIPGLTGYRSEVLAEVMIQEDKFVRLAEAIPAEKYTWRPAPDVRSVAEVFLHVSAANFNVYKLVGTPPPEGVDIKGLEKSTADKTKVIAILKNSFAHARKAIISMSDADLDKSLDWFGGKNTQRGVLLFVTRHAAEHLGQSIAYARFIGVVPPWTEDAQKQKQQQKQEAPPKAKQ